MRGMTTSPLRFSPRPQPPADGPAGPKIGRWAAGLARPRLAPGLLALGALLWGIFPAGAARAQSPTTDWIVRYNGIGNGNCQTTGLVVDASGCTYVTGYSSGVGWDWATVKYSPGGRQLHVARFNGTAGGDDVPLGICLDGRGEVYVCGYTDGNGQANYDFATIQYDSTLAQRWLRTYAGQLNVGLDEAYAVTADPAGNAYVTGFSFEAATGNDYVTIKYDAAGNQKWVQRYNGPGNFDDGANAVVLDPQGNVYVTGETSRNPQGGNYDCTTIKYDNNGNQHWVATFNGANNTNDGGLALALDAQGNVYVAGYSTGVGTLFDMLTLKYDQSGNQMWVRTFDANHGEDACLALTVDAAANVYVTGYATFQVPQCDYATIKYDTNGNRQWIASYDGPVSGFDEAKSVAVDAEGNVYITGYSDGGTGQVNYDYATLKYDPNGGRQWVMRYNGTGNNIDVAVSLALDSQNNVLVGGWSTNTHLTDVDFTTIKYDQQGSSGVPADPQAGGARPSLLLAPPQPDPFEQSAVVRFHLAREVPVQMSLWDATGRRVRSLPLGWLSAGDHAATVTGAGLERGVYLYRLTAGTQEVSGKLVRR